MTVVDRTDPSQTEAVTLEFELRHAPEKVWRALTDPVLLSEWLLPAVGFKLEAGAAFQFKAPPVGGWDGTVDCRFVEIEAKRKLKWTWVVGDIDTVVTFTLTPTSSGTHLLLVQSGFKPHQKHNFGGARYGLKMMGERLIELLGRIE
jgi:uncharacterized protein YndB with AHSA1/START domain